MNYNISYMERCMTPPIRSMILSEGFSWGDVKTVKCIRCNADIPEDAVFCPLCGKKNHRDYSKAKGDKGGCAYKDPRRSGWVAQVVMGYRKPDDPSKQPIPIKKTKWGLKTKAEAMAWCNKLLNEAAHPDYSLKQIYDLWEKWYSPRIDPSTAAGYRAAFAYYKDLHTEKIRNITAADLQKCMDACPKGKRTHQNMKVIAGLLWKYAKDKHLVTQVESENLYTGKGQSKKREALTDKEVEKIKNNIGKIRYADYIYCLTYLGYRPGEMLELRKDQVMEQDGTLFLIEGKKTEAGRNRIVPVHKQIEAIIRDRLFVPGTDLVFPMYNFTRAKKARFTGFKQMTDNYFREFVFKPMMQNLGIAEGKVPYSARHTFSNRLKKASGDDIDKAALMGHSDYTFTQTKYQSTSLDDLKKVVDSIE